MECSRCQNPRTTRNLFCACGKLYSKAELANVQVAGFVGVANSTNPKLERFWATGDPTGL
jgi:hypothetical protein